MFISEQTKWHSMDNRFQATNTMSYDINDILTSVEPKNSIIQTANGENIEVEGAGSIKFSQNITIDKCLFVPKLSHVWLENLIVHYYWLQMSVGFMKIRQRRSLGMVLRRMSYTTWMRCLIKKMYRLLMSLLSKNLWYGINN